MRCAIGEAISPQFLTAEARIHPQGHRCGICGDKEAPGQVFLRTILFFTASCHSTNASCSSFIRVGTMGPFQTAIPLPQPKINMKIPGDLFKSRMFSLCNIHKLLNAFIHLTLKYFPELFVLGRPLRLNCPQRRVKNVISWPKSDVILFCSRVERESRPNMFTLEISHCTRKLFKTKDFYFILSSGLRHRLVVLLVGTNISERHTATISYRPRQRIYVAPINLKSYERFRNISLLHILLIMIQRFLMSVILRLFAIFLL
jgi:hypothetical protein